MNTMVEKTKHWTGHIDFAQNSEHGSENDFAKSHMHTVQAQLCQAFNQSPFFAHSGMQMRVVDNQIEGFFAMQPNLIGNVAFEILHGGVAATMLDSVGGIVAMTALYARSKPDAIAQTTQQVSRLATVDMRVDYLNPGRGEYFIARAEVLRLGRKGCTMRMNLVNNNDLLIATAIASYAF